MDHKRIGGGQPDGRPKRAKLGRIAHLSRGSEPRDRFEPQRDSAPAVPAPRRKGQPTGSVREIPTKRDVPVA